MVWIMRTHGWNRADIWLQAWGHMICDIRKLYLWILGLHRKYTEVLVAPSQDACCTPPPRSKTPNSDNQQTRSYCTQGVLLSAACWLDINQGCEARWSLCCAISTLRRYVWHYEDIRFTMRTLAKSMRMYKGNHEDTRNKHEDVHRKQCGHTQKAWGRTQKNDVDTRKKHEDVNMKRCGHTQKAWGRTKETMWTHAKSMRTYTGNDVDTRKKHEDVTTKPWGHTQKAWGRKQETMWTHAKSMRTWVDNL